MKKRIREKSHIKIDGWDQKKIFLMLLIRIWSVNTKVKFPIKILSKTLEYLLNILIYIQIFDFQKPSIWKFQMKIQKVSLSK